MTSPTQRALAVLKKRGCVCQVVERWNSFAKRRIDLFGFIDIVALMHGTIVGIQVTSGTNHAARREKILAEPKARAWIEHRGQIDVWSWSKKGPRGKRKVWTLRIETLTEGDFIT